MPLICQSVAEAIGHSWCTKPFGSVPTHPFRVLGAKACGYVVGELGMHT